MRNTAVVRTAEVVIAIQSLSEALIGDCDPRFSVVILQFVRQSSRAFLTLAPFRLESFRDQFEVLDTTRNSLSTDYLCEYRAIKFVSGFGILMVLVGSFFLVVGFQTISDCSSNVSCVNCWTSFEQPRLSPRLFSRPRRFLRGCIMATWSVDPIGWNCC